MTAPRLLEGVRVIDLSQYIPGPFATRQLADLGADVIKIEPPAGDPMRRFAQPELGAVSPIYRHLNRGKRICRLDLKSDAGQARLRNLLTDADILLESYRPGALDRLGFGRKPLNALNPRLIHCALSGYGQNGPYQLRAGHDINYCAGSALLLGRGADEAPVIGFPPIADHAAAMQASILMLAALHNRDRENGVYLDISLFETSLSWSYLPLLADTRLDAVEILNGGAACYNLYRCADDRYISIGAIETAFWTNFCRALGRPDWAERQFEAMPQKELITEVAVIISSEPSAHWNALLGDVDCCYEPVYLSDEVEAHPQIDARQGLGADGPGYPGWIDGQPVTLAEDFAEIDTAENCVWR